MRFPRVTTGEPTTVKFAVVGPLVVAPIGIKRPGCRFAMSRPIGLLPGECGDLPSSPSFSTCYGADPAVDDRNPRRGGAVRQSSALWGNGHGETTFGRGTDNGSLALIQELDKVENLPDLNALGEPGLERPWWRPGPWPSRIPLRGRRGRFRTGIARAGLVLLEEIVYDEPGHSARRSVTGDCLDEQITVESVDEGVRHGRHGCRPRNVANECDLSEPITPADLAQLAAPVA